MMTESENRILGPLFLNLITDGQFGYQQASIFQDSPCLELV